MNRLLAALLLLVLACSAAAEDKKDIYRLRPGDATMVSVWRDEALQKEVRVLPDGSITFPLAGRIEVAGLTTVEAEQRIVARLKDFLGDPVVSVVVTSIDGNRAYVIGKVMKPGPLVMTGPTTVLQALSIAGGLDKFADEGAIRIIRSSGSGQEVLSVNFKSLVTGRDLSTNFTLKPGDTVIVP